MPPKSKAQAGLLGLIASGQRKSAGITQDQAREMLRGAKVKNLPKHKRSKNNPHPKRKARLRKV